jgi:hypothetical protein
VWRQDSLPSTEITKEPSIYSSRVPLRPPREAIFSQWKIKQTCHRNFHNHTVSQGEAQRQWAELLDNEATPLVPSSIGLYLVEDMNAASFRELARSRIKRKYKEGSRPVFLLDKNGATRRKFGVPQGKTVVLIYDKNNRLRLAISGEPIDSAIAQIKETIKIITPSP